MSGKRHHILPRFLLKGFANQQKGKEIYTWVYPKGKKPYTNNISKVSIDKHFYGKDGEINADIEITNLEFKYALLIDELRNKTYLDKIVEVEKTLIPDFIAHLSIRTKHLRVSLEESTQKFLIQVENHFSDFNNYKKLLIDKIKSEKPNTFLQPIYSEGSSFLDNRELELKEIPANVINSFKSLISETIRETHNKALAENPNPQIRAAMYQELRWFIYSSNEPLIIGDAGCLFEIDGYRRFKCFHDGTDKIKHIFLPIASNKILIGSHSQLSKIDVKTINEAIVKSSREFFICSEYSEYYTGLLPLIGKESELISQEEIEKIINESLNNL